MCSLFSLFIFSLDPTKPKVVLVKSTYLNFVYFESQIWLPRKEKILQELVGLYIFLSLQQMQGIPSIGKFVIKFSSICEKTNHSSLVKNVVKRRNFI